MPTPQPHFVYPLISQVNFDSAALGLKSTLAHPLQAAGTYHGKVMLGERFLAGFVIEVTAASSKLQAHVDLAELHPLGRGTAPNEVVKQFEVQVGGWMVCHVGHGEGGYWVTLREVQQRASWDSRQLERGDIFSMIPIRPGLYSLSNLANPNHTAVPLRVEYPDPRMVERNRPRRHPMYVVYRDDGFEQDAFTLWPAQGLVLTLEARAHFHLTLQRPDDGSDELRQWHEEQQIEWIRRTQHRTHYRPSQSGT